MSLRQMTEWCDGRFGPHAPSSDPRPRTYDLPWIVMDNAAATRDFGWMPQVGVRETLSRIAEHAERHPDWLERSGL